MTTVSGRTLADEFKDGAQESRSRREAAARTSGAFGGAPLGRRRREIDGGKTAALRETNHGGPIVPQEEDWLGAQVGV